MPEAQAAPGVQTTPPAQAVPEPPTAPSGTTVPGLGASPGAGPVVIPAEGPLSDAQLAAIAASARPATIRRAPRYRAFFWVGALVGIALGVPFGLGLSYDGMVNRWIYVVVIALGTTLVTVLVAGALAALVDKRGAARAARQRATSR